MTTTTDVILTDAGPLDDALAQLAGAVEKLGYGSGMHQLLAKPRREMSVSIPLRRDNGDVEVLSGYRVQHNFSRGPAKGGLRFSSRVPRRSSCAGDVDDVEVRVARRPVRRRQRRHHDRPTQYSTGELSRVTRRYTSEILPIIGPEKDIPAPDIGTDEQTMAWMMDTFSANVGYTVPSVVTGKPVSLGGSLGRSSATSKGVVHVALAALEYRGLTPSFATAAVQGFGKVGAGSAQFLAEAGVKVVAVGDQYGSIHNSNGLDIPALQAHVAATGTVRGFGDSEPIDAAALLELEVDLLVPAAVEGVINADNAANIRALIVVEGANGPTTAAADKILAAKNVLVVPDILANAGGVIVSYFEWVQGNQAYWWTANEVDERLETRMIQGWRCVLETSISRELSLREAATVTAVERVADAHLTRGLYP